MANLIFNSKRSKPSIPSIVHHGPLHEDEIRLVDFGADTNGSALINVPLDSKPDYIAISYCWGSENCLHRFQINQQILILTSSLHAVFAELWQQGYRGKIWADAICIRQDDDNEKSIQIPLMRDIYQNAAEVLAWLGSSQACHDIPMAVIDRLLGSYDTKMDEPALFPTFEEAIRRLDLPPGNSQLWRDIAEVLTSPWFGRLWTLQEAVIPTRLFTGFGHIVIAWRTLVLLASTLQRHHFESFWARQSGRHYGTLNLPGIAAMDICRRGYYANDLSMMTLFAVSRGRRVTHIQDRVYAIYGFMNVSARHLVPIDLHASPEVLFVRAAKAMVTLEPDLELLAGAETRSRLPGLPSWVPDLTAREPPWILARYCGYNAGLADTLPPELSVSLPDDERHLSAAGFHFDTVMAVQPTFPAYGELSMSYQGEVSEFAKDFNRRIDSCRRLIQHSQNPPMPDYRVWSSLERVLVGDRPQWRMHPFQSSPESGLGYLQEVVAQMHRAAQGLSHDFGQSHEYANTVSRFNVSRSLFITSTGQIGLGSNTLQAGDHILILRGSETPFAARKGPTDSCYELLGECFVDGIMEGQAYEAHMASRKQDEILVFE